MRLDITLIGDVAVRREGDDPARPLAGANARLVLALLVVERDRGTTPERLAEALWPDGLPTTWGSALRMTVSRVRSFLKDAIGTDVDDPIVAQGGRYRLALPGGVELDVDLDDAERSLAAAREALTHDPAAAHRHARRAAERLRGPFLAGRAGGWVDEQRDRLSDLLVAALEVASRAAAAAGDAAAALAAADEAVERAPLRESAHRARMAAHAAAGNRAEALRAYQRLRRVLAEELGVDPDAETEAAYLDLLGPAPTSRAASASSRAGAGGPAEPARDVLPFVGREPELAVLGAAWDQAAAGGRHVVVISGEAGIGKSRLATEAARRAAASGGLVLFGRCDQEAIVPYQPLVEALDGYVAATPADELPALDDRARAELAAVLPSLEGPRTASPPEGDGRARLFDAVTALVASMAAERPVMLVLDDLQWAGGDTLLLVRHLLRRSPPEAPVLVVAISRDHDVAPGSVLGDVVHALDRDGWARRLPLRGLAEADVHSLVRLTGGVAPPPRDLAALARRLVAETAGNPFLVTEMLRAGSLAGGNRPIPPSVHELVAARMAGLDPATTELLRAAAVAGARFELDLVGHAAGLDGAAMLDALDAALGSGLIAEDTAERYRFPHDIVRRTLVAQLSGARRRALHGRLADAIEADRADRLDAYAPILAHHASAAASPHGDGRAVHWSRAAAAQASERRAVAEAARLGRQALAHVPTGDDGLRAEVMAELAMTLLAAGDPAAEQTLMDAATLARRHDRADVLGRLALALADRSAERSRLRAEAVALVDAAVSALVSAPAGAADEAAELLRARLVARQVVLAGPAPAHRVADAPLVASATGVLRRQLTTVAGPDRLDERATLAADLAALAALTEDLETTVVAAHERAMAAALAGDDDTVQACLQVIDEAATKGENPLAAALIAEHEAAQAALTGRFGDATLAIEAAARRRGVVDGADVGAALARRHRAVLAWMRAPSAAEGDRRPRGRDGAVTTVDTALDLIVRGDRDQARVVLRDLASGVAGPHIEGDRPQSHRPESDDRLHDLGVMALVAADVGEPGLAERVRGMLAPYADLTCGVGYRTFVGVAAFHLGRLAAVAGDWADAERHMLAALRRFSALRARPWVAFTQAVLADVLAARGRPSDREWLAALRGESRWVTATLGLRTL